MAMGGVVHYHIGDIVHFDSVERANKFLKQLRDGLTEQKTPLSAQESHRVRVRAYFFFQPEIERIAAEKKAAPYPGVVAYLDEGAKHACREFEIRYTTSAIFDREIPEWAKPTIDETYYSKYSYAGRDPQ